MTIGASISFLKLYSETLTMKPLGDSRYQRGSKPVSTKSRQLPQKWGNSHFIVHWMHFANNRPQVAETTFNARYNTASNLCLYAVYIVLFIPVSVNLHRCIPPNLFLLILLLKKSLSMTHQNNLPSDMFAQFVEFLIYFLFMSGCELSHISKALTVNSCFMFLRNHTFINHWCT